MSFHKRNVFKEYFKNAIKYSTYLSNQNFLVVRPHPLADLLPFFRNSENNLLYSSKKGKKPRVPFFSFLLSLLPHLSLTSFLPQPITCHHWPQATISDQPNRCFLTFFPGFDQVPKPHPRLNVLSCFCKGSELLTSMFTKLGWILLFLLGFDVMTCHKYKGVSCISFLCWFLKSKTQTLCQLVFPRMHGGSTIDRIPWGKAVFWFRSLVLLLHQVGANLNIRYEVILG